MSDNIIFWIIGIIWVLGWLKLWAEIDSIVSKHHLTYPNDQVRKMIPFVLFFTWPYFYFYGKAK